jgi:hypothetical protein
MIRARSAFGDGLLWELVSSLFRVFRATQGRVAAVGFAVMELKGAVDQWKVAEGLRGVA